MIFHCACDHSYQDSLYGTHNRVFNRRQKKDKTHLAVCTVCGREANVGEPAKKAVK